jgi:peptidoglycan/xylan/chitin deacetylase (PgdA/CDA1 family)
VIDVDASNGLATVVGDLRRAEAIPSATYDCIVLTQTLQLIDDVPAVLAECERILRPGGVLLATVPSVIRVDDESGPDGDYWRFTEASARKLFADVFPVEAFEVTPFGNVLACSAFLYGLSAEELSPTDLDHVDTTFPVVIAVRAVKLTPVGDSAARFGVASDGDRTCSGVILVYHRIASLTPDSHGLCTPPEIFREHMDLIRRSFCPISLEDLVRAAAQGCIPERAVAVTLDDGYLDALTTASPILSDCRVPATFFVNTDRLDQQHERWWDMLESVFSSERIPHALRLQVNGEALNLATASAAERALALKRLNETAWPMSACARAGLVHDVLSWSQVNGFPRATHRVLTGDEIRTLASRPDHGIGAHTVNHLALSAQPVETRRTEIADSKTTLEQLLGRPVQLFSYPYGDFDADTLAIVLESGFLAAVTVETGMVRSGVNRLLIPRCEAAAIDRDALADRLLRMFEGLH